MWLARAGLAAWVAVTLTGCSAIWPEAVGTAPVRVGDLTVTPIGAARATRSPAAVADQPTATRRLARRLPTGGLPTSGQPAIRLDAATVGGGLDPRLVNLPPRVYVPNEKSGDVAVIDPTTFRIVDRFTVGPSPEHITPSWDLSRLYVNTMGGSRLTVLDPNTAEPTRTIGVPSPYNLYFTLDGSKAIVVDDFLTTASLNHNGLAFYDRRTWQLLKFLRVPYPGVDHLDMSADGRFLLATGETSGMAVRVDTRRMTITGSVRLGGLPVDVRLSPDGRRFFIANQGLSGITVVDAATLKVRRFIRTGTGAHGLAISRDATKLYVTNRKAGTISVIDVASLKVVATAKVGASPDMIAVSPDGTQMWVSNRYNGTVDVVDPGTLRVIKTIATGANPHGLIYWPQPGRLSLGHNGIMR